MLFLFFKKDSYATYPILKPITFFHQTPILRRIGQKKTSFFVQFTGLKIPFVKKSEPFVVKSATQAFDLRLPKKPCFLIKILL